jgi:hypothetical protein
MGKKFEQMTEQFRTLVQALVSTGKTQDLVANDAYVELTIGDSAGPMLRMRLYDVPSGKRGQDLRFMYGLQADDGAEVLPVALPGDILEALTNVAGRKF